MTKTINSADLKPIPYEFTPKGVAPQPLTPIDREFKKAFRELLDLRAEREDWRFSVRPSALPLCPWKVMLAELLGDTSPPEIMSFSREFYLEVGNTAHRVIQKWLGRLGILFGPYECRRCLHVELSLGAPKVCPKCTDSNPDWVYREINLKDVDPSGLFKSAHADGLVHFTWQEANHYYLVDFKTCSLHSMPTSEYGLIRDYHKKYLLQTGVYAHLLSRFDDIHIDGTVLVFIPRDDPKQLSAIVVDQTETNGEIYHTVIEEVRSARKAAKTGETSEIRRDCLKQSDAGDCTFQKLCFDRSATETLFIRRNSKLPVLPSF